MGSKTSSIWFWYVFSWLKNNRSIYKCSISQIISCSRLAFENLSSYGFKANPFRWVDYIMWDPLSRPTFFLFLALHAFILFALILEKCYVSYLYGNQRAQKFADGTTQFETTNKEETIFQVIYLINLASMLALPVVISQVFHCNPFLLSFICLIYSATCLKIFSFHQVNSWWRTGKIYGRTYEELPNLSKLESKVEDYVENILKPQKEKGSQLILYPQNLNIANVIYYFYVPTLCYQLNFPRTKNINWYFVLRCLFEFVSIITGYLFINIIVCFYYKAFSHWIGNCFIWAVDHRSFTAATVYFRWTFCAPIYFEMD